MNKHLAALLLPSTLVAAGLAFATPASASSPPVKARQLYSCNDVLGVEDPIAVAVLADLGVAQDTGEVGVKCTPMSIGGSTGRYIPVCGDAPGVLGGEVVLHADRITDVADVENCQTFV